MIPPFDDTGYLPPGVHPATLDEIDARFGRASELRRVQMESVRWMVDLARRAGVQRIVLNGSFVTAKEEPQDVDTVILLPQNFSQQLEQEHPAALELEEMLLTRRPEEIFAAEDGADWEEWVAFFSLTREPDRRRKGLVEISL